jgi:hypothetical protein
MKPLFILVQNNQQTKYIKYHEIQIYFLSIHGIYNHLIQSAVSGY